MKTLAGPPAQTLLAALEAADDAGRQMLPAKATGNFKRGNERAAAQKRGR